MKLCGVSLDKSVHRNVTASLRTQAVDTVIRILKDIVQWSVYMTYDDVSWFTKLQTLNVPMCALGKYFDSSVL